MSGRGGRRDCLLAAQQAGLFRDRVFPRHALADLEPGDSDRQYHGGALSVSSVDRIRGVGGLRAAIADGAEAGSAEDGAGGAGRRSVGTCRPDLCPEYRLGGPGTLLAQRGGSRPRQLQDQPGGGQQRRLSHAAGLGPGGE